MGGSCFVSEECVDGLSCMNGLCAGGVEEGQECVFIGIQGNDNCDIGLFCNITSFLCVNKLAGNIFFGGKSDFCRVFGV